MLLTLATIPEEPGSEAHDLEKLSIRELQLRLITERAKLAEVQPQDTGVSESTSVLHKCSVRGCISEPTGFGRGRQSSLIEVYGDDVSKPEGVCGVNSYGDWSLVAGRNARKKSLAVAEHWTVALGEWDDDAAPQVAETILSTGAAGSGEVRGHLQCPAHEVESEPGAELNAAMRPASLEEVTQYESAVGRGGSHTTYRREDDLRQEPSEHLYRIGKNSGSEGVTEQGCVGSGGEFDMRINVKNGRQSDAVQSTTVDSTGFDTPELRAANSSCPAGTSNGKATDSGITGTTNRGGILSPAAESCLVEALKPETIQPLLGGQGKTFREISQLNLVPFSSVEPRDLSEPETDPYPESSGDGRLPATSLSEEKGEGSSPHDPLFSEGILAIGRVSIARKDINRRQCEVAQHLPECVNRLLSDITTGDDSKHDGSMNEVESSLGSGGLPADFVSPVHRRSRGHLVAEASDSLVEDACSATECHRSSMGGTPPVLNDGLTSISAPDSHVLMTGPQALHSSGSQYIVRPLGGHRAPSITDYAKDTEGGLSGASVPSLTVTIASGVTPDSVVDSDVVAVTSFDFDRHPDSSVRDDSIHFRDSFKSGLSQPGEYTTLLEKNARSPTAGIGNTSTKTSTVPNGGSFVGTDEDAMASKTPHPHPRSPLLDLQDRVSFGAVGQTASDLRSDTTEELSEVTGLVDALVCDSLEARSLAAEKIRILTKYNAKARTRMGQFDATDSSGKHGLIPALVAFLHSSVHYDQVDVLAVRKAQEMAACALLNLGVNNDRNKAAIVAAGAVPELVELLRGNAGARTKEAAVGALLTLSCLQENHAHMGSTRGTISQLVHVLRRGTKQACKDALTALNNLTASMTNRQRMVRAGAVRALTRLMATGDYGESPQSDDPLIQDAVIGEKCVALLYNLSSSKEGREAILNTNGTLAVLCDMLDSELSTVKEKEHGASTLWNLCSNSPYHCQLVKEEGVTPALIALSVEGSPRAQEKARLLLTLLSSIPDQRGASQEQASVRSRTVGSLPRQLELSLADDGYFASESEKSLENSSPSDSLCSTPASQPLRMPWSGPEVHHSAPLERPTQKRDFNGRTGTRRSILGSWLKHINPLGRHHRSASSLVPFCRKS